jgi:hypothetical protein
MVKSYSQHNTYDNISNYSYSRSYPQKNYIKYIYQQYITTLTENYYIYIIGKVKFKVAKYSICYK